VRGRLEGSGGVSVVGAHAGLCGVSMVGAHGWLCGVSMVGAHGGLCGRVHGGSHGGFWRLVHGKATALTLVVASTAAPTSRSCRTTSCCPYLEAQYSGVHPS
jgi:hypothetical protein